MLGKLEIIGTGTIIGLISLILVMFGNPANMGFCIACFVRDTAGALGFHRAEVVQYVRPEVIGIVFGALLMAYRNKEFVVKGGSSPITRFLLGIVVMVGALIFLGCPLRMLLRLAGGDLNAAVGLFGFVAGIGAGVFFINRGFSLRKNYELQKVEGFIFPAVNLMILLILILVPTLLFFSEKGPGASHAPIVISLIAGLVVGVISQKSRICFVGGIRDAILFKDFYLFFGLLAILATVAIGNLLLGKFNLGFIGQPVAHNEFIWNFAGLFLVGFASALLGGCPLKQMVLAGSGNTDSVITIFGLFAGAAISHNFKLASSAEGATQNGKIGFFVCLAVVLAIAIFNTKKQALE